MRLLAEFLYKCWTQIRLDTLLSKLQETGSTGRPRHGNGRPKCAHTEENVAGVHDERHSAKKASHKPTIQHTRYRERRVSLSPLGMSHTPRSWFEVSGEIPCVRTERSDDAFIMPDSWPPNNHDLTPSNYKIWSNKATRHKFRV